MKFSGKLLLWIILKATKSHGFTLSLEDTFFEKPQEGRKKGSPYSPAVLRLTYIYSIRSLEKATNFFCLHETKSFNLAKCFRL